MKRLPFRIVNVFARPGEPFSGNPLCVFEDGQGLTTETMQALARQTNLSETTFLLPPFDPARATAHVRIFTPTGEMPFAGHPTLGTAHVLRALRNGGDAVTLEMKAGLVRVESQGDEWTLETAHGPKTRAPEASNHELASTVGVSSLGGAPLWVNTGVEQLVVPLASAEDVARALPSSELLTRYAARTSGDKSSVYVWARDEAGGPHAVLARYFFVQHGGVIEDPATGSACANLGGWLLAAGAEGPIERTIDQGGAVGRRSRLGLSVREERIFVRGLVIDIGHGTIELD